MRQAIFTTVTVCILAGCDKPPAPGPQGQAASQPSVLETSGPSARPKGGDERTSSPPAPATPPGPGDVVRKYFEAGSRGKHSEAYGYMCAEDRAVVTLEAYVKESNENAGLGQLFAAKTSYAVKSVKVDGDKAAVILEVTRPDMSGLFRDVMAQSLAGKLDDPETKKKLADKVASQELPLATSEAVHDVVRDPDGWKVRLGRARRKQLEDLMGKAESFAKEGRLEEAIEKFKEVLSIDPDHKIAEIRMRSVTERAAEEKAKAERLKREAERVERELERKREAAAYLPNVQLRGITTGKTSGGDPRVEGEIKNLGDRTVTKCTVTIYCLDAAGKPVHEEDRWPVNTESRSFYSDSHLPLKPNYVRMLGATLKSTPSDWAGKVDVKITLLELADLPGAKPGEAVPPPGPAAEPSSPSPKAKVEREEAEYLPKIELRDVQLSTPERGDPRVTYEVKNLGDRTLSRLELAVYYLDATGKPVYEKRALPVLTGTFSTGESGQPLKPNYSRKATVFLDNIPSDWGRKVDVKITRCEFLKGE